ncbi:DUF6881 domain-containing protein [Streptomyces niveus]|uniref:DUF6881 domain-containing protein n=1 Tax=Streptomyces niveus TaxID=193462 RepID=UPI00367EB17F
MEHWKVEWVHDFSAEPVTIYSEVGDDGYETRKIQKFRDGRILKADEHHETGEIGLSEAPVGPIEEVAEQPEFHAFHISLSEFEELWERARWPQRNG